MDIEKNWQKALSETEVLRTRLRYLETFSHTEAPYIFLAESGVNIGDTIVRKGKIFIEKPSIILPGNIPQFLGFDFEDLLNMGPGNVADFLLIRGIRFPSLKYDNRISTIDVFEGSLKKAIKYYENKLQKSEDIKTGLIIGPEECWQLSVLIFIASAVSRSADIDIKRLFDKYRHN